MSTDGVTIAAPSEAGRWSLWALSLSNRGLRFSTPRTINVFRPIQLDFALPPALKVGETVEVDVKITNNINNCMDVSIFFIEILPATVRRFDSHLRLMYL